MYMYCYSGFTPYKSLVDVTHLVKNIFLWSNRINEFYIVHLTSTSVIDGDIVN